MDPSKNPIPMLTFLFFILKKDIKNRVLGMQLKTLFQKEHRSSNLQRLNQQMNRPFHEGKIKSNIPLDGSPSRSCKEHFSFFPLCFLPCYHMLDVFEM